MWTASIARMLGFKQGEYVRTCVDICLVLHQLCVGEILCTYAGPRHINNPCRVAFYGKVLDCYSISTCLSFLE